MVKKVRSPLPIDLLNLLGSFVGDDYHFLTFELTPKGFLSHHRIFMQSRHNPRKKSKAFDYHTQILEVYYPSFTYSKMVRNRYKNKKHWHTDYNQKYLLTIRERYPDETNIKYARACRDYIKLGIIWL